MKTLQKIAYSGQNRLIVLLPPIIMKINNHNYKF